MSVGDLCDFINGNGFKSSEWAESGLPIIRIQNLNGSKDFNYFNGEVKDKWLVMTGDILFAWAGTKGVSFGAKLWDGPEGVLNQHIFRVEPKEDVNPAWLYLSLKRVTQRVENMAHGFKATLLHVQKSDITEQVVYVPVLEEQKKIAKILSSWDKAITTTEKLLANSQQQKKALMQQLLTGKTRFPRFDGEWQEYQISDMGKVVSGGTPDTTKTDYWDGDVCWMTPTDVTALKTRFIKNTNRKITMSGVKNSSATLIPAGSLLVCTRATVGLMSISTSEITTNQGFKSLIPNNTFDVNFLYYLFSFNKKEFVRFACGSTFMEISKKDFMKLRLRCPSLEEQAVIASVLSGIDEEIEKIRTALANLICEKRALMQQLLTGKRRVSID